MTSRRRQQDARRQQRSLGIPYGQGLRNVRRSAAPSGAPGSLDPGHVTGSAGGAVPSPPPQWDERYLNDAESAAVGRVVGMRGDALPREAVRVVARYLGLPSYDGDVIAARVALDPAPFYGASSDVTASYDYGLEVHEVTVLFAADIEITVTASEAQVLLAKGAVVVIPDESDPTLLVTGVRLELSAQIRVEAEHVEIMDEIYEIR